MSESETSRRAGSRAAPRPAPASRRARGGHTSGPQAQQHLLRAAAELFYREGVRAVGVDAVVERAGVNKMSLYRQFSSKDDLVMAYLEHKDAQFFGYVEKSFAQHPGDPARQLQQYFDDLAARASLEGYRGCPFVNVAVEFADTEHAARQFVFRNKERLLARLTELATAAGADDPEMLANSLALLIEGVYAASQTYRAGSGPVLAAPKAAARLIAAACGGKVER
ncbi:TetR/AcrR family transcriptional regulator [bacterium M00.F.Ca.ET.228.01.1.1]|uniref:TetR/AcrR family transcriptional regulator n=1 Tax=Paraburkholderia phenoliruptrix TaxID=252970 RepID=UPI0010931A4A|nr:TetR/AcrR family transcriptional regulator [Paraburkholderia phenoliruptrix]TGP40913.1 TetR/AcrR family transcriptional regulator [bacterium M00.F.Ca.ET.228.01.1.1]TGR97229.1 TetR/AcrR family transcriptional regulator [bacterium M00.F.Ca.ET.191.01.1.1]TGU01743.1 TetR/AcrR family transcriptional regulator [bacterium M00.F.Ca.ET.155.01.1.1]MBW0449784.1 TetR/AcrR family transcriptional regulator [Paraburkholderia phenoliruptrix]MBW9100757.1 TetR/AcrR family transcriptional regulator [Paraburkh